MWRGRWLSAAQIDSRDEQSRRAAPQSHKRRKKLDSFGRAIRSEQLARRRRKTGECCSSSVRDNSKPCRDQHAGREARWLALGESH